MTAKELKNLSRSDLLELLIEQTEKNIRLQKELEEARQKLLSREIAISNAGSMAEATMQLNGVMQAVDQAAAQYLTNVLKRCEEQEAKCAELEADYERRAQELMEDTRLKCAELERSTQERCDAMLQDAERESQTYWDRVYEKLEQLCACHESLKGLLQRKD